MGVDWVPCRIEPGVAPDELECLVDLESRHFVASGHALDPRLIQIKAMTGVEKEQIKAAYRAAGELHHRLLMKHHDSHRVYVVTHDELFPLEWRLHAYRTILPWQLADQLHAWQTYRAEVRRGLHRAYLCQLLAYLRSMEQADYFRETIMPPSDLPQSTASWARLPETIAAHQELRAAQAPAPLPPPGWNAVNSDLEQATANLALVVAERQRVNELIARWNLAVKRGNYKIKKLDPVPPLEAWILRWLDDPWFASFVQWLEPWIAGGYGLYRDCE